MKHAQFRKIVAHTLSVNFREATSIITADFPESIKPTEVVVKNKFVGINASDINFTAGIYQPDVRPPFDCGFEALGEVVEVGSAVKNLRAGDAVVTQHFGSFAEYQVVPQRNAKRIPSLMKEYLPLDLSGTTASIALAEVLRPLRGEKAMVTAASGGTGQFASQLLKHVYGCTVLGTCSSEAKAAFLMNDLKLDAAVQSGSGAEAEVDKEIRALFPTGVNVAYESVGGDMLDCVVRALALKGRVLSIGSISCYTAESREGPRGERKPLPLQLLSKSATMHTFFLPHYSKYAPKHFAQLCTHLENGTIKSFVDPVEFRGLEGVYDGIGHMYARKNVGKIIVEL